MREVREKLLRGAGRQLWSSDVSRHDLGNDETHCVHIIGEIHKQLQGLAPEFRKIEGFPIGNDEVTLNMNEPLYYITYPSP